MDGTSTRQYLKDLNKLLAEDGQKPLPEMPNPTYKKCEQCGGEWFTQMVRIPEGNLQMFAVNLEYKVKCVSCGTESQMKLF